METIPAKETQMKITSIIPLGKKVLLSSVCLHRALKCSILNGQIRAEFTYRQFQN